MTSLDEKMMALALKEARKGWGGTSPNPMVGAVVANGEHVVAKGYHIRAGGPHAEVHALRKAGEHARGATIYVTLEPCNHYGRTPPCTVGILDAGIRRVVVAQMDPNPKVAGGGAAFLAARGLEVTTGVLAELAAELNRFFTKFITTGRPYVILKSAATLDGKLASRTGHSKWVTGEKSREYVHRIRYGVDAILVGRRTVEIDNPSLNIRLPGRKTTRDPLRVVLDTRLELSSSLRVFNRETGGRTVVACGLAAARDRIARLEDMGVDVWPLPLHNGRVRLASVLEKLGEMDVTSLMIEGGGELNHAALIEERIVDEVMLFYAPKIIGGRTAPTLVDGEGLAAMDQSLALEIKQIRRLGSDILILAKPAY